MRNDTTEPGAERLHTTIGIVLLLLVASFFIFVFAGVFTGFVDPGDYAKQAELMIIGFGGMVGGIGILILVSERYGTGSEYRGGKP